MAHLKTVVPAAATILVAVSLSACGGTAGAANPPDPSSPLAKPALTLMVISDPATIGAYSPPSATAHAGDVIEWTFADKNPHTVTADNGSFDSKPKSNGQTFTITAGKAGTYKYHCSIHPEMHGTVEIG